MKADAPKTQRCEDTANARLSEQWNNIDWNKAETYVKRLQTRIAKAMTKGENDLVKRLSYLLTHSFYAKALAVRKVTSNIGRRTAGVDGERWLNSASKMKGVLSLTDKRYKAKPLWRIYIPKSNGKLRPLSIPTMYDRSMQMLYALALDPISETTADTDSYGFRKGRCCQDAGEHIHVKTRKGTKADWVVETDVSACFDSISHRWIVENIPMDKSVLKQFLNAGFIFQKKMFPVWAGVPQGGVISPIIANMTLDGMQGFLNEKLPNGRAKLVRYADDSVCICRTEEDAIRAKEVMSEFLSVRGLELNGEKTLITKLTDGFDFLGFNFTRRKGDKMIAKPSKKAVKRITEKLHEIILDNGRAMTQDDLIEILNPIIRGWAEYHRHNCAKVTFSDIDQAIFELLFKWARKRHPNKGLRWIVNRYWRTIGKRKWCFATDDNILLKMDSIPIRRHMKVRRDANPYLDTDYFDERRLKRRIKPQKDPKLMGVNVRTAVNRTVI